MKTIITGAAAAALLCLCASSAFAKTPPATDPKAAPPAPAAANEKPICRRDEGSAETRIPKKTCHSKAEWDAIDKAAQEQVQRLTTDLNKAQNAH